MTYLPIYLPASLLLKDPLHLQFRQLSKREARAYFDWFISIIFDRIDQLSSEISQHPENRSWEPDLSPESLALLGKWFVKHLRIRSRSPQEMADIYAKSPEWFNSIELEDWDLSHETYSLCFDIGVYLAKTMQENIRGLSWRVVFSPSNSVDINQPVLSGFGKMDFNPVRMAVTQAFGSLRGNFDENGLVELYRIWSSLAS